MKRSGVPIALVNRLASDVVTKNPNLTEAPKERPGHRSLLPNFQLQLTGHRPSSGDTF
jgi:hypothetical protein